MVAAVLGAAVLWPVARALARDTTVAPFARQVYVVHEGDTLWSIATRHGGGDPRPLVLAIERANRVDPAHLVPGRTLVIPSA